MAAIAGILVLIAFGALVLSIIALIRPLPSFWLPTRKRAGYICGLSLGLMVAVSPLLPEPAPPTPEELAAIAAEEKREAEEAEARRKVEEAERDLPPLVLGESGCDEKGVYGTKDRLVCSKLREGCLKEVAQGTFDASFSWCEEQYTWRGKPY